MEACTGGSVQRFFIWMGNCLPTNIELFKLFIDRKTCESQNALVLSGIVELYTALQTPLVAAKLLIVVECSFRCDRILQKYKLSHVFMLQLNTSVFTCTYYILYCDLNWAILTQRLCFELSFNIAAIAKWLGSFFLQKSEPHDLATRLLWALPR